MAFSWYLLVPLLLEPLYGATQYRAVAALGFPVQKARAGWFWIPLAEAVLVAVWLITGFPLPAVYILVYGIQAVMLLCKRHVRLRKAWFLLNIRLTNIMVLHLVFVGCLALIKGIAMYTLLADALWRTVSVSFVLAVCIVEDLFFLHWPDFAARFAADAESEEARPFLAFLWFCAVFQLGDSLLCISELDSLYSPLFLIGSNVVLIFFLIRFLLHINAMIREEQQRDEHIHLSAQLEAAQVNAGLLKRMSDQDMLTGAFSRRYIMTQLDALIRNEQLFSLAFLDLDGLKKRNDLEGHDAGDRYLIGFTKALGDELRSGDLLARIGGDEFLVLMPGCDQDTARRRIGEVRDTLETDGNLARYRFSFGVATLPPGTHKAADALLREADQAMYLDKAQRR